MTVSEISSVIWNVGSEFMGLAVPIGEYRISFMTIFIFAVVGRILMQFVNRILERQSEEEGNEY